MAKRTRLICAVLLGCVAIIAFLETARRNWAVRAWLSVLAHGQVFYRVVHTTELSRPIPVHYPMHTLESQHLVYSGNKYLGYLSKHGLFVPDGQSFDLAAMREGRLIVVCFVLELLLASGVVTSGVLFVLKIWLRDRSQHLEKPGPLA